MRVRQPCFGNPGQQVLAKVRYIGSTTDIPLSRRDIFHPRYKHLYEIAR